MIRRRATFAAVAMAGALVLSGCNLVGRVSVPLGGGPLNPVASTSPSSSPALSSDGGFAAFSSAAADLVTGDTNGTSDIFVRNQATGATSRASLTEGGGQASGSSTEPALSGDGRFVAFTSTANDLVAGDGNGVADVFVRDRVAGTTVRASVGAGGAEALGASGEPAISADGRYVAFTSSAANLVANDTNGVGDIFVRDLVDATTTRVSVTAGGAQVSGASSEPAISPSGEWVAFTSSAATLVSGDSNGAADVFLARRTGGSVRRASVPDAITRPFQQSNGASSRPSVTDGVTGYTGGGEPVVAYQSAATNLAGTDGNGSGNDVFATTWAFGTLAVTVRLSPGSLGGHTPTIGVVDGGPGYVAAYVQALGGAPGEIVTVERDTPISTAGVQARVVSLTQSQTPANGPSAEPAISSDGRFVAFTSTAGNLAGGQMASSVGDVFLARARTTAATSVEPGRVGLLETRDLIIRGRGFEPTSSVGFEAGIQVNSVTFVSSSELVANVTATSTTPGDTFRDVYVFTKGAAGSNFGFSGATCASCVEIAAVVEQPGPVDLEITGGSLRFGTTTLPLPGCIGDACVALPATVDSDGNLSFGLSDVALDPIPIDVELFPGVTTTIELVPTFVAPAGSVVPANGAVQLSGGLAIKLRNPLLGSNCALGPVQFNASAGPGGNPAGVAYDPLTGEATLVGGLTEELAITGCGFFTSTLNSLLGLPIPIGDNELSLQLRFDPVLTGTIIP
jgi:Tol biopolymer transport system component